MKLFGWSLAAAATILVLPAHAIDMESGPRGNITSGPAAVGDAELILYRFPGVTDNGGAANTGVATSFHCTTFDTAAVDQTVRIVIRGSTGVNLVNIAATVPHLNTVTFSTHPTVVFQDAGATQNLNTGFIGQGTAAIAATSINVICTAMIVDAAAPNTVHDAGNPTVVGVPLRGVRFNPIPGAQE